MTEFGVWKELNGNVEQIHHTFRMKVAGGWLVLTKQVQTMKNSEFSNGAATSVSVDIGMVQTFIPDPNHDMWR